MRQKLAAAASRARERPARSRTRRTCRPYSRERRRASSRHCPPPPPARRTPLESAKVAGGPRPRSRGRVGTSPVWQVARMEQVTVRLQRLAKDPKGEVGTAVAVAFALAIVGEGIVPCSLPAPRRVRPASPCLGTSTARDARRSSRAWSTRSARLALTHLRNKFSSVQVIAKPRSIGSFFNKCRLFVLGAPRPHRRGPPPGSAPPIRSTAASKVG